MATTPAEVAAADQMTAAREAYIKDRTDTKARKKYHDAVAKLQKLRNEDPVRLGGHAFGEER
jgi:hypothetical protein